MPGKCYLKLLERLSQFLWSSFPFPLGGYSVYNSFVTQTLNPVLKVIKLDPKLWKSNIYRTEAVTHASMI
jgi:hypothetical protein